MNITKEIEKYELMYDRFPYQTLSLPYSLDEITIQPNETVSSDTINLKLQHLYENFLSIYTQTKIASNIIPISSTAILGMSSLFTNLAWNYGLSTSDFFPVQWSIPSEFNNIKTLHMVPTPDRDQYTIFSSNGNILFIINSSSTESFILSTTSIYDISQIQFSESTLFNDIVAITDGPDNSIIILDRGTNTLYQYDPSGFTQDNNILANTLAIKNALGGYGLEADNLSFNNPLDVVTYKKDIFVLDAGNNCVKRYNNNFAWLNTYRLNRDFVNRPPKKLKVDAFGNFYCVLSGNQVNIYSNDFQQKQEILVDYLNQHENIMDIVFSKTNTNIYYLITDENVYKGLVNNPGNTIGKYLLYLHKYNDTQAISAFATVPAGVNDRNLIVSKNSATSAQIIGAFYDNINLYDNLSIPNFDIYDMDDIKIAPEEYVQSWVLNKSLAKLIANHLRLVGQLIGKFQFKFDSRGNSIFQFTRYLTAAEKAQLTSDVGNIL
jgi:hypothetical protein